MNLKTYDINDRTIEYSISLIRFIDKLNVKPLYHSLVKQLIRSGTSIGANIHEGRSGSTSKDFINFMHIALKSANETKYWLEICEKGLEIKSEELGKIKTETEEISKIIAKIIINTKENQKTKSN